MAFRPKHSFGLRLIPGPAGSSFVGDRDLLFAAIANLADSAIEFTPERGASTRAQPRKRRVRCSRFQFGTWNRRARVRRGSQALLRSDKVRSTTGVGLGLNVVVAIARLHGFRFTISPAPAA
jgi:signal transduction histidine kinase